MDRQGCLSHRLCGVDSIDWKPYGDQTIDLRNFNLKPKG